MHKIDWLCGIDKEKFISFIKDKLKINFFDVEKRFNKDYGTYFAVYSDDISEGVKYFGNYGIINVKCLDGKMIFIDDFEVLNNNKKFMNDYVSFVSCENKVNGNDVKRSGKTYINDVNEKLNEYLEENREKGEK